VKHRGKVAEDLAGRRFTRLVVMERVPAGDRRRGVWWKCQCDCGKVRVVIAPLLRNGGTKSCGCWSRDNARTRRTTHGKSHSPTWWSWSAMVARCSNPRNKSYSYYGGRGIKVCERWRKFDAFLADMGERPERGTIDRIDVDGDYCPENCRWATRAEQTANRRPAKDQKIEPHEYAQIRWLRNECGYKLAEIGAMFDVSDGHVCSIAKGVHGGP